MEDLLLLDDFIAKKDHLEQKFIESITSATDSCEIESVRLSIFGKKGLFPSLFSQLHALPAEEKKSKGALLHASQKKLLETFTKQKEAVDAKNLEAMLTKEGLDVTQPLFSSPLLRGRIHPLTRTRRDVYDILTSLGLSYVRCPEVEQDRRNFSALNFADDHPARQMHDTFYLSNQASGLYEGPKQEYLLRTHTSTLQTYVLAEQKAPIYAFTLGRTFRNDSDATHTPQFHQVDVAIVDNNIHLGHLQKMLQDFLCAFFQKDQVLLRFRPSFFPFTEPSFEVDIAYKKEKNGAFIMGEGNSWLEILGCGMIHPQVFLQNGLNPKENKGFAFGVGFDRLTLLREQLSDLRAFFETDLAFSHAFGKNACDIFA